MSDSPSPLAISRGHTETKKILLLEDDDLVGRFVKMALESKSFEVVKVENGVEGVREIKDHDFDAIICDMMMPKLPGDMFYLAVQRMKPHLCERFIFMTGFKDDAKILDFIKRVNGAILIKPFKVDDLLEMIAFIQVRPHLPS